MKGLILMIVSFFTFTIFAQDVVTPISTTDFVQLFLASLGGLKGASTLAIITVVLKLLFAFLNSELAGRLAFMKNMEAGLKLFFILLISYATGVTTLMLSENLSFGAAFIHSTSMSALIVLLNQAYKKFVEKK